VRRAGVDRSKKFSENDIVPVDLALNGAQRYVITVDKACVSRVAVTAGKFGAGKSGAGGLTPPQVGMRQCSQHYPLHFYTRVS